MSAIGGALQLVVAVHSFLVGSRRAFWWTLATPVMVAAALVGIAGCAVLIVAGAFASVALPLVDRARRTA